MTEANDTPTTPPKKIGQPFDDHIVEMLQPHLIELFLQHGDVLRSVGVVFDFYGELNDANINHAIWLGPQGSVTTPDGVIGTAAATMRFLELVLRRGFHMKNLLQEQLTKLQAEILEAQKQLQAPDPSTGSGD